MIVSDPWNDPPAIPPRSERPPCYKLFYNLEDRCVVVFEVDKRLLPLREVREELNKLEFTTAKRIIWAMTPYTESNEARLAEHGVLELYNPLGIPRTGLDLINIFATIYHLDCATYTF
jgi:hypothetical protein